MPAYKPPVRSLGMMVALAPAIITLLITLIISIATNHPRGLFLTLSTRGFAVRFVFITLVLVAPILLLPKLLAMAATIAKHEGLFGQLAKTINGDLEFTKVTAWVTRPAQGIGVSLIVAERFLPFLEYSTTVNVPFALLTIVFVMGGALTSLFLSTVWALDDLGFRIYNGKTGEVRMAGNTIGVILPLITGAIGVASLFHEDFSLDSLLLLVQIVLVLYPPYVLFASIHHLFLRRRSAILSKNMIVRTIETRLA
jgi:hypothetical protein